MFSERIDNKQAWSAAAAARRGKPVPVARARLPTCPPKTTKNSHYEWHTLIDELMPLWHCCKLEHLLGLAVAMQQPCYATGIMLLNKCDNTYGMWPLTEIFISLAGLGISSSNPSGRAPGISFTFFYPEKSAASCTENVPRESEEEEEAPNFFFEIALFKARSQLGMQ